MTHKQPLTAEERHRQYLLYAETNGFWPLPHIVRPGEDSGVSYTETGIYCGNWCAACNCHSMGHKGCLLCKGRPDVEGVTA